MAKKKQTHQEKDMEIGRLKKQVTDLKKENKAKDELIADMVKAADEPTIIPGKDLAGGDEPARPERSETPEPDCRSCDHYPLKGIAPTTHNMAGVRAVTKNFTHRPCGQLVMKEGPDGKEVPVMEAFNCKGKEYRPAE